MKQIGALCITGVVLMVLGYGCCTRMEYTDAAAAGKVEASPRFDQGSFTGNGVELNMSGRQQLATAWEFFFSSGARTPNSELPRQQVDPDQLTVSPDTGLRATWLGHSSVLISIDGFTVLTDPVFEQRVTLLGPSRFNGEVPLKVDRLPPVDVVIISHDHYDHLNKYSVRKLKDKAGVFIVPLRVGLRLRDWGVAADKIVELDWWEQYGAAGGLTVTATPAQHFSGRGLTDRNKTLWASWVIASDQHRVFFSGDTGYFPGLKEIGDKFGPFAMTFIECGAYDAAWSAVHMFPEQTVQAHIDLRGQLLHPIHWGTFNLALHPWYEPMQRLVAAAGTSGIEVATPPVGGTTQFGRRLSPVWWWEATLASRERPVTVSAQ